MEGTKFRSKSVTMQSDEERSSLRCKASSDHITAIRKREWRGLTGTVSWKIWLAGLTAKSGSFACLPQVAVALQMG